MEALLIVVARESIRIAQPPAAVYDAIVDLEAMPQWFPGIVAMRATDDLAPGSVGKRYAERARIPLRGELQAKVEVVAATPGQHLAFQADLAPVLPRFDLTLRDVGEGHTQLTWTCRSRAQGAPTRWLALPVMRAILTRRARTALARLRGRIETGRTTMQAMQATAFGEASSVLRLASDASLPEVGARDVLVRVVASSVNPIDCRRRGGYGRRLLGARGAATLPLVLGRDVSGEVVAVGAQVRRFRPGDRIWGAVDTFRPGAWAEFVAADESDLAPRPGNLDAEQAAALPYVALTTWAALVDRAGLNAKQSAGLRVLVHAGAGGVGSFAIQLLKAWGAEVTTTCRGANRAFVEALGADRVVDYEHEDYAAVLRDYDVALDTLGGEHEARTLGVLKERAGARYVSLVHPLMEWTDRYGLLLGGLRAASRLSTRKLEQRLRHGRRYDWSVFRPNPAALLEVGKLVESGAIQPRIEAVFPIAELAKANAQVETGRTRGKIVIRVAEDS